MRNFIIFFEEKEGTSPLVRLLDHFDQISMVHQIKNRGWEPFDRHNCGPIQTSTLLQCFDLIFDKNPLSFDRLNEIYATQAVAPLESLNKHGSVGFKMRFLPPNPAAFLWFKLMEPLSKALGQTGFSRSFERSIIQKSQANDLTVFLAARQDVFRWALSKYHGDGTGKPGHLQFAIADGNLSRDQIGKIYVDPGRFERIIQACERSHAEKRRLLRTFQAAGVRAYPLLYEEFVLDKVAYFERLLRQLEINIPRSEVEATLGMGSHFKKVHSSEISEFVENHEEITERFGHRYVKWEEPA